MINRKMRYFYILCWMEGFEIWRVSPLERPPCGLQPCTCLAPTWGWEPQMVLASTWTLSCLLQGGPLGEGLWACDSRARLFLGARGPGFAAEPALSQRHLSHWDETGLRTSLGRAGCPRASLRVCDPGAQWAAERAACELGDQPMVTLRRVFTQSSWPPCPIFPWEGKETSLLKLPLLSPPWRRGPCGSLQS